MMAAKHMMPRIILIFRNMVSSLCLCLRERACKAVCRKRPKPLAAYLKTSSGKRVRRGWLLYIAPFGEAAAQTDFTACIVAANIGKNSFFPKK